MLTVRADKIEDYRRL